jgi:hypothetical protein
MEWSAVLGRFHHGIGHDGASNVRAGCYKDTLAARQMEWWHQIAQWRAEVWR